LLNLIVFICSSSPVDTCLFSYVAQQNTAKIVAKFTHAVLSCVIFVQKLLTNLSAHW